MVTVSCVCRETIRTGRPRLFPCSFLSIDRSIDPWIVELSGWFRSDSVALFTYLLTYLLTSLGRDAHDELLLDERAQLHEHLHAQRLQLRLGLEVIG